MPIAHTSRCVCGVAGASLASGAFKQIGDLGAGQQPQAGRPVASFHLGRGRSRW